jgi:hypothetical protein
MNANSTPRQYDFIALLCYLWIPGWIVAALIAQRHPSDFRSFHLRQGLGLLLLTLLLFFLMKFKLLVVLIYVGCAVFGWLNVFGDKCSGIPVFGNLFNQWFKAL